MMRDDLIELLNAHEWRDVEFKEAQHAVPRNAYETVSAFANTDGGHLVFGVRKNGQEFKVVGVLDVDKVQNDFLTTLRDRQKLSVIVDVREELQEFEGSDLLIFFVPEVRRSDKPVFLNGNITQTYIRSGGSDVRCSTGELNRFLTDAAPERYDGQSAPFNVDTALDWDSVRWYRAIYEGRPENRSYATLSDVDFLNEVGLLVEEHGRVLPSRAAILLFGANATFRQLLPRPVVDCQRFSLNRDGADTGARWIDRRVLDENLVRTWQALIDWYQKFADQPFRVDPSSLQRDDAPPDYRAFRESMVNLLIHQDYADHSRKAEIRYYADQTVFWNTGDAFATDADLLEPGEKEVRNPRIVTAFRRIGLSENAGWGLRDVFRNWQQLGHVPPTIRNVKGRKYFELILRKEELLSEQQVLFQAGLGVQLTSEQARVFAVGCREKAVTVSQIKVIAGLAGPDAIALADALVTKMLFRKIEAGRKYALAEHLLQHPALTDQVGDKRADLVSDQAGAVTGKLVSDQPQRLQNLTENQWKIVMLCDVPRSVADLMRIFGLTHRTFFRRNHLEPLVRGGVLRMTHPEQPNHPDQAYVLTEDGLNLKARRVNGD